MKQEEEIYSYKPIKDPWGMERASQKRRIKDYINNLKSFFKNKKFDSAIDLTCGDGILTHELGIFCKNLLACDYSENMLTLCEVNTLNKFDYGLNKLPKLDVRGNFDLIFAIESLYYLNNNELIEFFKNVNKIMKKDSFLIITLKKSIFIQANTAFIIVKSYPRYLELFPFTDLFYSIERFFTHLSLILRDKNNYYSLKKIKNKKIEILIKYKYFFYPLLLFIPLKPLCRFVYKSTVIDFIFYHLGKLFNIQHERQLLIVQKK